MTSGSEGSARSALPARCTDATDLPRARRSHGGFTYLGLLIAITLMGISLSAVGTVSRTLQLREREAELLFVGDQFRRAIASYYEKTPGPVKQYPPSLDALLKDNRFPDVQRHLRKIYVEPITGKKEWGLVEIPGRGIAGVYSLSEEQPIKVANFPALYESFAAATQYSDWKFVYTPMATPTTPTLGLTAAPAATPSPTPAPFPPAVPSVRGR